MLIGHKHNHLCQTCRSALGSGATENDWIIELDWNQYDQVYEGSATLTAAEFDSLKNNGISKRGPQTLEFLHPKNDGEGPESDVPSILKPN